MSNVMVKVTAVIEASPEEIYDVVGDYLVGHHAIMPEKYFPELVVEKGGQGVGTIVLVTARFMGQERTTRMEVIEAERGRWILERELNTGHTTTSYKFEPLNEGRQTRLTITTVTNAGAGIRGFVENLLTPPAMRRMYNAELRQIADYFRTHPSTMTAN